MITCPRCDSDDPAERWSITTETEAGDEAALVPCDFEDFHNPKVIVHEGLRPERLDHPASALEKIYAEVWKEENIGGVCAPILQTLLSESAHPTSMWGGKPIYVVNQRDAHVAGTVIQWLGTNVGRAFVARVAAQYEEKKT